MLLSMLCYLWEGTIVPDVAMIGEAVVDKADLSFLHILLYRVELLLSVDLRRDKWGYIHCTLTPCNNNTTFTFTTSKLGYHSGTREALQ